MACWWGGDRVHFKVEEAFVVVLSSSYWCTHARLSLPLWQLECSVTGLLTVTQTVILAFISSSFFCYNMNRYRWSLESLPLILSHVDDMQNYYSHNLASHFSLYWRWPFNDCLQAFYYCICITYFLLLNATSCRTIIIYLCDFAYNIIGHRQLCECVDVCIYVYLYIVCVCVCVCIWVWKGPPHLPPFPNQLVFRCRGPRCVRLMDV